MSADTKCANCGHHTTLHYGGKGCRAVNEQNVLCDCNEFYDEAAVEDRAPFTAAHVVSADEVSPGVFRYHRHSLFAAGLLGEDGR